VVINCTSVTPNPCLIVGNALDGAISNTCITKQKNELILLGFTKCVLSVSECNINNHFCHSIDLLQLIYEQIWIRDSFELRHIAYSAI